MPEETPKKKKRRYVDILKLPLEHLTGWQEVNMDIDKVRDSLEAARVARTKE
jgi:hypothetical protein